MDSTSDTTPKKRNLNWLNIISALLLLGGAIMIIKPTSSPESVEPGTGLFSMAGETYTLETLPLKYSHKLHEIEARSYQLKMSLIETAISELYVEQQVEGGKDRQAVIQELFDLKPPSEEEIQAFYQSNQNLIKVPYDQARQQIASLIAAKKLQLRKQELVEKLVDVNEVKLYMQPPKAPQAELDTSGFASKGNASSNLTLVEFGDYQCGHCKNAHDTLNQVLPEYLDRIQFVYMHLPVNSSGISRRVAEGSVCAQAQDKFWQYHDQAFARQSSMSEATPLEIATDLELDLGRFEACLNDEATAAFVEASAQQAIKAGITSTPSFLINGRLLGQNDLRGGFPALLDSLLDNNTDAAGL